MSCAQVGETHERRQPSLNTPHKTHSTHPHTTPQTCTSASASATTPTPHPYPPHPPLPPTPTHIHLYPPISTSTHPYPPLPTLPPPPQRCGRSSSRRSALTLSSLSWRRSCRTLVRRGSQSTPTRPSCRRSQIHRSSRHSSRSKTWMRVWDQRTFSPGIRPLHSP